MKTKIGVMKEEIERIREIEHKIMIASTTGETNKVARIVVGATETMMISTQTAPAIIQPTKTRDKKRGMNEIKKGKVPLILGVINNFRALPNNQRIDKGSRIRKI